MHRLPARQFFPGERRDARVAQLCLCQLSNTSLLSAQCGTLASMTRREHDHLSPSRACMPWQAGTRTRCRGVSTTRQGHGVASCACLVHAAPRSPGTSKQHTMDTTRRQATHVVASTRGRTSLSASASHRSQEVRCNHKRLHRIQVFAAFGAAVTTCAAARDKGVSITDGQAVRVRPVHAQSGHSAEPTGRAEAAQCTHNTSFSFHVDGRDAGALTLA